MRTARRRRPPALERRSQGKQFVLTGSLETMTRDEAKAAIEARGRPGHLVGLQEDDRTSWWASDPGSKLDKAKELGVAHPGRGGFPALLEAGLPG